MHIQSYISVTSRLKVIIASGVFLIVSFLIVHQVRADANDTSTGGRLITFHDRGQEKVILTHAQTIREALKDAEIKVTDRDVIEPKLDSKLIATDYTVNIYRARPIIVVDGMIRQKIMTAAQTPKAVVSALGGTLQSEDEVITSVNEDIVANGAGIVMTIDRATNFTLKLYGKVINAYSQAETVGAMLEKKGIKLDTTDTVSISKESPLVAGMMVEVWREGVQTTTVEEDIDYPVRVVQDADRLVGYKEVQTFGVKGKKEVVYEITAQAGKEVGRKAIQSVTTLQPQEEVVVIGTKPSPNALTKSKGAQQFTDSKGVVHRETYYDLPMSVVMGACGGGAYSVRADGAKIDKDGYILIAANLGNYPRCSIVETSMGPGKVYDTGGFAARHPHGFDLATDWTNNDGR